MLQGDEVSLYRALASVKAGAKDSRWCTSARWIMGVGMNITIALRPPDVMAGLVEALAEELSSGCPSGCMYNAAMCRLFSRDFSIGEDETPAHALARAMVDPCRCWCHSIRFEVLLGRIHVR